MITNLNHLTFSEFGSVLDDRRPDRGLVSPDNWIKETISSSRDEPAGFFTYTSDVYLDYGDGMSVLLVAAGDSASSIRFFYLDKPVRIQRGVAFSVSPFENSCTVSLLRSEDAVCTHIADLPAGSDFAVTPQFGVKRLYTVFYQEKERGFFFKGEQHTPFELTYVDKGSMHNVAGGNKFTLNQHEYMLFSPNQFHMQYADPDIMVNFLTVSFNLDCPFSERLTGRKFVADPSSAALISRFITESDSDAMFSQDAMLSLLNLFIIGMFRTENIDHAGKKPVSAARVGSENTIVDSALRYIAANPRSRISVSTLAASCSVSAAYLSALFQKHIGQAPGEYLTRVRMEESKLILRQGKHNVSETAALLGFSSVQHFSSQFKQHFGITPSEYARALK